MRLARVILCGLFAIFGALPCLAAMYTYTATARPGADPDAIDANSQPANAWQVLLANDNDTAVNGDVLGDSGTNGTNGSSGAGAGTSAWGLYSLDGFGALAYGSIANLTGAPLTHPNESVSFNFDNGLLDGQSEIDIQFLDASNQSQLTFALRGPDSPLTYKVIDTNPDTPDTFDTMLLSNTDGFNLKLTLAEEAGKYDLSVNGTSLFAAARQLMQGSSSIGAIGIQITTSADARPNSDIFFNDLVISTVPEASPAVAIPVAISVIGLWTSAGRRRRRPGRQPDVRHELSC